MNGLGASNSPTSRQQAEVHWPLFFAADNTRSAIVHHMHGSRSRSVEAAVSRSCCCLKQKITPDD